jgi:hypothetical protein
MVKYIYSQIATRHLVKGRAIGQTPGISDIVVDEDYGRTDLATFSPWE